MRERECPDIQAALAEYAAGALPQRQRVETAHHLEGCEACRKELAALGATAALLDATRPLVPRRDLWPEVVARLSERRARRSWWALPPVIQRRWAAGGLVAVLLVVLVVGVMVRVQGPAPTPAGTLVAQVDEEAPQYARWYAEASMTSALADRYALAFVVSAQPPAAREAGEQ